METLRFRWYSSGEHRGGFDSVMKRTPCCLQPTIWLSIRGYAKSNHLENDTKMSSLKKTMIRTLNTPNFQIRKTVQKSLKCFETRTMIFSMTKQHLEQRSNAHGKSEKKQHWHDTIANYEVTTSGWRLFLHSSAETGLNRWQKL